jgi:hypothetical protein
MGTNFLTILVALFTIIGLISFVRNVFEFICDVIAFLLERRERKLAYELIQENREAMSEQMLQYQYAIKLTATKIDNAIRHMETIIEIDELVTGSADEKYAKRLDKVKAISDKLNGVRTTLDNKISGNTNN